ncbi:hypothetical protein M0813_26775 [Anaeramoeba flamelloides]|uniref:GIT Spa2 homology (SHD) domain-containing protein n=1 Tax=Anaeramoeba flamelloides TaxID=1746091 RepID=A0ABQ8XX84_9EUKA|nr:hypothetical protein M0813_26775 [Anaeramoeba flamelloides]
MGITLEKAILKKDLKSLRSIVPKKVSPNKYETNNFFDEKLTSNKVYVAIEEETTVFHQAIRYCGEKILIYLLLIGADPYLPVIRTSSKKPMNKIVAQFIGLSIQNMDSVNSGNHNLEEVISKPVTKQISSIDYAREVGNKSAVRVLRNFQSSPSNFKKQYADLYKIPRQFLKIVASRNKENKFDMESKKVNENESKNKNKSEISSQISGEKEKTINLETLEERRSENGNENENENEKEKEKEKENKSEHGSQKENGSKQGMEPNYSYSSFNSNSNFNENMNQKKTITPSKEIVSSSFRSKNSSKSIKSNRESQTSFSTRSIKSEKNLKQTNYHHHDRDDDNDIDGQYQLNLSSIFEIHEKMNPQQYITKNNIHDVYKLIQVIKRVYFSDDDNENGNQTGNENENKKENGKFKTFNSISERQKQLQIDPEIIIGLHKLRIMNKYLISIQKETETETKTETETETERESNMEKDPELEIPNDILNHSENIKKLISELNEKIQKDLEINEFFKKIPIILANIVKMPFKYNYNNPNEIYIGFFNKHHKKLCKVENSRKKFSKLFKDLSDSIIYDNEEHTKLLISLVNKENKNLKKLIREEKEYKLITENISLLIDCNSKIKNKQNKIKQIK